MGSNILGAIVTAGVAILAIAIMAMITGQTLISLPGFNENGTAQEQAWAATMTTTGANAGTAFTLLGIAPLVLGAAVIISIVISAFLFMDR